VTISDDNLRKEIDELVTKLANIRREKGLSQLQLSEIMGTTQGVVSYTESLKRNVRLITVMSYAKSLGKKIRLVIEDE